MYIAFFPKTEATSFIENITNDKEALKFINNLEGGVIYNLEDEDDVQQLVISNNLGNLRNSVCCSFEFGKSKYEELLAEIAYDEDVAKAKEESNGNNLDEFFIAMNGFLKSMEEMLGNYSKIEHKCHHDCGKCHNRLDD